jgi:hypothetical protein
VAGKQAGSVANNSNSLPPPVSNNPPQQSLPPAAIEGGRGNDPADSETSREAFDGAVEVLTLLRVLGDGFRLLCRYECSAAINEFKKLSKSQYNSGWVLTQVGKAYYEILDNVTVRF